MKDTKVTQANIVKFCKKDFKNKIVQTMEKAPFSKQMIEVYLFIPELNLSEFFNELFNELLQENLIFVIGEHICPLSKINTKFYVAEKLLSHLNSLQNDN